MLWLAVAWAWLKRWGGLIIAAVASGLAFVFYELWTKKQNGQQSVVSPETLEQHEAEQAAAQTVEAQRRAALDVQAAEDAAQANWTADVQQAQQQTAIIQGSDDAVGRMLDAAGRQQRSP